MKMDISANMLNAPIMGFDVKSVAPVHPRLTLLKRFV